MKRISIGYSEENDVVIKDKTISRKHASIEVEGSEFWLEDLNSTNGVFVNNRKIKKVKVDHKDQIVFGAKALDVPSLFNKISKILRHRKTDFTDEYKEMIILMEEFYGKKSKILDESKWPKILRIGLSVCLILILFFFPDLIPDANMRYVLIMGIGMVPVLLNVFSENKQKKQEKMDLLKLEFEDRIKCPKCRTKLIQFTPVYIKAKGRCINEKCNAVFEL